MASKRSELDNDLITDDASAPAGVAATGGDAMVTDKDAANADGNNVTATARAGAHVAEPGISAMLWFRCSPDDDVVVLEGLRRMAQGCEAAGAEARIGHRHEEDRPYRTWMIDAGPVAADKLDALLWRLQKAFMATGLQALSQGEEHTECFEWRPVPQT